MKKFFLSASLVLGFGVYWLFNPASQSSAAVSAPIAVNTTQPAQQTFTSPTSAAPPPTPTPTTPTPVTTVPKPTPTPTPTPAPKSKPTGQYVDGTYTGSQADAYYGIVQVRAVVSGGKLTDVQILSSPSDRGTSVRINSIAMPYLVQEAIQAQSANVNTISGASDSSAAFRQSLGDALSQAKA